MFQNDHVVSPKDLKEVIRRKCPRRNVWCIASGQADMYDWAMRVLVKDVIRAMAHVEGVSSTDVCASRLHRRVVAHLCVNVYDYNVTRVAALLRSDRKTVASYARETLLTDDKLMELAIKVKRSLDHASYPNQR